MKPMFFQCEKKCDEFGSKYKLMSRVNYGYYNVAKYYQPGKFVMCLVEKQRLKMSLCLCASGQ